MTTPMPPGVTLEQAGILPGSRFRATPEEQAESEAEERRLIEQRRAALQSTFDTQWTCAVCRAASCFGRPTGRCVDCDREQARLRAEAAMAEQVNGTTRRQLNADYFARQQRAV